LVLEFGLDKELDRSGNISNLPAKPTVTPSSVIHAARPMTSLKSVIRTSTLPPGLLQPRGVRAEVPRKW